VPRIGKKVLAKVKTSLDGRRAYYKPEALNHTDVACDNFIKTSKGLRLIDWEKPRVDDCTYDLCCFLSEPVQLWCSEKAMSSADQEAFLHTYARVRKQDLDLLAEKIKIREPIVSLHWILWGALKLCYFKEHSTARELLKSHEEGQRYDGIEKIDKDGTVHFCGDSVNIMKEMIGLDCQVSKLEETEERSKELGIKFREFSKKYQ